MSTKRKRSVLSIKEKQIIISRLDKGEKGTNLALAFGISKQQISDICKNKDKILKFTNNIETTEGLKRKSLKLANDERLDQALYMYTWFIQQRLTGTPIAGPLLQEKVKHFSLQCTTVCHKELWSRHEKSAPGLKKAKDRLTVLGCTNATGTHKLKPVLIGKSVKPKCFKNVNMDALPVIYKSQRNAWMNSEIFAEWFSKEFIPAVKRHQRLQNIRSPKALLLIDN